MSYETTNRPPQPAPQPQQQPGVGLGDIIAGITRALGITPCEPCKKRQQWLNDRMRIRRPW